MSIKILIRIYKCNIQLHFDPLHPSIESIFALIKFRNDNQIFMKKELKRADGKGTYVTITFEKQNDLIFVDWNGFLPVELVKAGSEELLKIIKEVKCANVLVNNQKVSGPWQAANGWYQTDWNPRAAKEGLTTMAVIMSDNIFTQLSLQGFTKVSKDAYTVGVFNSDNQARNWIKEQQKEAKAVIA